MVFRKAFIAALLGSTMLAGCDGSDDKKDTAQSQGTFNAKLDEANGRVASLSTEVDGLKKANGALTNELVELKTVNGTLANQVGELRNADGTLATQVGELKNADGSLNKQVDALKSADNTARVTALEAQGEGLITAGAAGDAKIRELQGALSSLEGITKNVKLEVMQSHIADLQGELTRLQPSAAALDAMTGRTAALRTRTDAADKADMSADDLSAVDGHLQDVGVIEEGIAAKQEDIAAALAKGDAILKSINELPDDASVAQVAGIDKDLTALSAELKSGTKPLQEGLATFDKEITALKGKIGDLTGQSLPNYVNTMRGAQSSGDFTRGNTFPATAMPFGFNMWSPVNRSDPNWFYQFKTGENGDPINTVRAFAVVHEPSPWIGNRQSLGIMPIENETATSFSNQEQAFDRKREVAQAHYYSLVFNNGTQTEITPTDHAAYFRFTVPADKQVLTVLFDTLVSGGAFAYDAASGAVSGYTTHGSPKMYFYAAFDAPVTKSKAVYGDTSWVQFDVANGSKSVGMRIATSFISVEQAKSNLDQEIGTKSFEAVKDLAEAAWLGKLGTIRVKGATDDQKKILYSNMYRAFLYPNSAWENVDGQPTYISPYTAPPAKKPGKIWVNNGFWDTYRTNWPLYSLLMPTQAGLMIDGFVNGYKDGGWVTRWSGPGYADSMVATSSDIIFADAYLKGVRNFDVDAAYASMLRNATTVSTEGAKGRKGMDTSVFYGYKTDNNESVAWSLEAYLNDFGIAQLAKALKKDDDYAYFMNRAISYPNIFDGASKDVWAGGFFRSKGTDGNWQSGPRNPQTWGYGYTEGNAWSYAFLAPQDGQGLANLYGGRQQLKDKLDTFFKTDPGLDAGSYWSVIHEIREAKKVDELANLGEYQHSNQPVHHSIYMYNYAGAPASGQNYLRDVMDKLYFSGFDSQGNSTGEGYIGDEDNGEQSAWFVLSAMGIYPVSMGRPEYAIGAPYFPSMSVKLENGKKITINASNVSSSNRYVQSLKLNGKNITRSYLLHSELAEGATLDFEMGPNPSQWGTGVDDVPTSITQGDKKPTPLKSLLPAVYDVTASTDANKARIFDRTSSSVWANPAGTAGWIEAGKKPSPSVDTVSLYTLTSADLAGQDPVGWTLKGSNDGKAWTTLDSRDAQTFDWRRQTRPFALKAPAAYARYRLEFTGTSALSLAELELLGTPDTTPAPPPPAPAG
jgi:predicted alpha-1,2-mannosidase